MNFVTPARPAMPLQNDPMNASDPLEEIPSENALASLWKEQARTYGDCRRWTMDDSERCQWNQCGLPALTNLKIFSGGCFVEAWNHRWERSNYEEGVLAYCTAGKGIYRSGESEWQINKGDLLYAPPLSDHAYWADPHEPWTIHWMHLSGDAVPQYEKILGLRDHGPVRHIGVQPDVISAFDQLIGYPQLSGGGPSHWLGIQASALSVLGRIAELPLNIADIANEYTVIRKAMRLMMDAIDQSYDANRFAREAGYGTRHFNRMFRHVAGMPPSEWFAIRKIQRARSLLSIPNILVKEVAAQLGYDDPLYFSRVFRRIAGTSPQNYQSGVMEQ